MKKRLLRRAIERRLGGFKQQWNRVDPTLPQRIGAPRRATVIGGGIAGLTAATVLARRGFAVTLLEKNPYLGGKVGAWPFTLSDGTQVSVEHGFHAFFKQYYNLNRFLDSIGAADSLVPISDYHIETQGHGGFGFAGVDKTPVLNMLSMARAGIYSMKAMARNPDARRLLAFLRYEADGTYEKYDDLAYEDFANAAKLPPELRIIFNTFSRAFFAEGHLQSTAEIIKSFHFYFLSNDCGLIYDYPDDDYAITILGPALGALQQQGARVELSHEVAHVDPRGQGFSVDGEACDYVVLAADVKGIEAICRESRSIAAASPHLYSRLQSLKASQRYAILRFWTDRVVSWDLPPFVITDKVGVLDSVSVYHMIEKSSQKWSEKTGGGIYELHCYAVPDTYGSEQEVRDRFLADLCQVFPQFVDVRITDESMQLRDDFSAFHTGLHRSRPTVTTEIPGLYLAGDWVKLPVPAMLMEAACTAGLMAANEILQSEGLRPEPVFHVPIRGLLAPRG